MTKKPRPLERKENTLRDAKLFIIATEDTYAPEEYFHIFRSSRVQVKTLETEDGLSSPEHVLDRLNKYRRDFEENVDDEFWLMLDIDHWTQQDHITNFRKVCTNAVNSGYKLAHSNPCFEIWLLLHLDELDKQNRYANYRDVKRHLKKFGAIHKKNIKNSLFSLENAMIAINRAKKLDSNSGDRWPQTAGSHVYKIAERLLEFLSKQPYG